MSRKKSSELVKQQELVQQIVQQKTMKIDGEKK